MTYELIIIVLLLIIIIILTQKGKKCPKCKSELPSFRFPTSFHQTFWGGWTCPKCGTEIDRKGNKIKH